MLKEVRNVENFATFSRVIESPLPEGEVQHTETKGREDDRFAMVQIHLFEHEFIQGAVNEVVVAASLLGQVNRGVLA